MKKVMVVYSRADKEIVAAIHDKIINRSHDAFRVWRDTNDIQPGTEWEKENGYILSYCDVGLVFVSENSCRPDSYVNTVEIPRLKTRYDTGDEVKLLSTAIDDVPRPPSLSKFQGISVEVDLGNVPLEGAPEREQWVKKQADAIIQAVNGWNRPPTYCEKVIAAQREVESALQNWRQSIEQSGIAQDLKNQMARCASALDYAIKEPRCDIFFSVDAQLSAYRNQRHDWSIADSEVNLESALDEVDRAMLALRLVLEEQNYPWPDHEGQLSPMRPRADASEQSRQLRDAHSKTADRFEAATLGDKSVNDNIASELTASSRLAANLLEGAKHDVFGTTFYTDRLSQSANRAQEEASFLPGEGRNLPITDALFAFDPETLNTVTRETIDNSFSPPPDVKTRKQWELEAAVSIVLGEPVPRERRPHLRTLRISGFDDDLYEALKARGIDLKTVYVNPDGPARKLLFSDAQGLNGLTGLNALELRRTQLRDLSPLSGLTALNVLFLSDTQVSDLTPLSGLTALNGLNLEGTQVSDLTPLSGLTALDWLYLYGTQVSDLTPLSGLTALNVLSLNRTQVSDWSPVAHVEHVGGRPENWRELHGDEDAGA